MSNDSYKLFDLPQVELVKHIAKLRRLAPQITINTEKANKYKRAVSKYLEFMRIESANFLNKNGIEDLFAMAIYNSLLITDQHQKRIVVTKPFIKNSQEDSIKRWYEQKFASGQAFSLIPESLESHGYKNLPQKFLLKLGNEGADAVSLVKELDISFCYAEESKWKNFYKRARRDNIEDLLEELFDCSEDSCNKLAMCKKAFEGFKIGGKKLDQNQVLSFVALWYPLYIDEFVFQYYIPAPLYSDTPVGGFVFGTKKVLSNEQVKLMEDIALKAFVNINALEHKEKVMQQSRRTVVAAIMGRNMSHNIGSHVIWHLTQKLTVSKHFYDYLRERMGFVGLISTASPCWVLEYELSKILDYFYFDGQSLLLQNIVKTEKKDLSIVIEWDKASCKREVELPHGLYGAHAFFTILENIIRNTIKHNIKKIKTATVKFTVSLEEQPEHEDYYKVMITDNLAGYSNDLDDLVKDLNKKIREAIIDEGGKLINKHLGFKEKRICAAFLRLVPLEALDCIARKRKMPLLHVENNGNNLAHVLYFKKPKKVLIITENQTILRDREAFLKKGIYVEGKNKITNLKDFTHHFLVLDVVDNDVKKFDEKNNKLTLPFRILTKRDLDNKTIPSDPDECYLFLWKKWLNKFIEDGCKSIGIKLILSNLPDETIKKIEDDNILEVVGNKTGSDDYDSQGHIVLSHDVKIGKEKDVYKNAYFIEGIKSGGSDPLYNMISSVVDGATFLLYKMYEAFLYKIALVDERIFEKKDTIIKSKEIEPSDKWNDGEEFTLRSLWEKRQVKIIDHDSIIKEDNWQSIFSFKPDILIIHQGVIDKHKDEWKANEFIEAWEKIKKEIKYIIIDSDRGRPGDIKELSARWLQFSDLSSIVIDKAKTNIAKILLVNLITSIREP